MKLEKRMAELEAEMVGRLVKLTMPDGTVREVRGGRHWLEMADELNRGTTISEDTAAVLTAVADDSRTHMREAIQCFAQGDADLEAMTAEELAALDRGEGDNLETTQTKGRIQ